MTDPVPPARQCTMPDCLRPATDPTSRTALCATHAPKDTETADANPECEANKAASSSPENRRKERKRGSWENAKWADPEPDTFAPAWTEREFWMGHKPGDKYPFAPWADANAPVECDKHGEPTTCAECGHDARYKWGYTENWTDFEEAREWAETDHRLAGLVALIDGGDDPYTDDPDPFAFVDGDDVRCPETGEVHPAFVDVLDRLGATYADVSTSGGGVHALYRGSLPDGVKQAKLPIDDEPFGANDDPPVVEIYDHKKVCVVTGDHVPGTGLAVEPWDEDELADLLDEHDKLPETDRSGTPAESIDLDDYTPTATGVNETTDDYRDVRAALDRLDARRVAEKTIVHSWNDSASTSGNKRAFRPTWGPSSNGTANVVDDEIWQDTGGGGYGGPVVMALIDRGDMRPANATPRRANGELWWRGVDHLRDLGFGIPEYVPSSDDEENTEAPRDLLDLEVVVEPANALAAAAAVEPADLDRDLPELERDGVEDVAIAVAIAEGWIDSPDEFPSDGRYTEAYYRARDHYGAPLPKYLDNSTLAERDDLVIAALDRVRPEHILDGCRSEVTVDDPNGAAIAKLNPSWEDSESGERILAGYGPGFYCVEHETSFSPIQLAALEEGLIADETEYPRGEAFKQAYRVLGEVYGAPLPKWRATVFEHVAVLPPSVRILDDDASAHTPSETLDEARARTETLVRNALDVHDRAQLITALPGTGKTYSTVAASDDHPSLYISGRNELKAQTEAYAEEVCADEDHHPDAEPSVAHLPILAENTLPEEAQMAACGAVREHGRDLLRDGETLLATVKPYLDDEDVAEADQTDEVDLQRPTCPTAEGDHGEAWRVRVQVAKALEHTPAEIHRRDEALFGEPLPCHADGGECAYSEGWDRVRDPDAPIDLLVGSPGHAFVDSATTHFSRDNDGDRVEDPRGVVIDEFPEDAYFSTYGERFMDHAVWLGEALAGVESREDLLDAGLDTDTWVNVWVDGAGEEFGLAADAIEALAAAGDVADAAATAEGILDDERINAASGNTSVNVRRLREAVETVAEAAPADGETLTDAVDDLDGFADRITRDADHAYANGRDVAGELYALADELEDTVEALARGVDAVDISEDGLLGTVKARLDALPVGGDFRALLDAAVSAVENGRSDGILDAATTALRGGRDGCRELALFATDGYAHPDAWALLAGAVADVDDDHVREVREATFAFDHEAEGGVFKRLNKNSATIIADKNHHGALVVDPPAFTDMTGDKCPVIGLDATGRTELWRHAIGRDVQRRDIHETDTQRRRFLREVVNLRVIQTSDNPLSYHSSPEGKNFQEDLALVEAVADEYTGTGSGAIDDKGPAVISTKKVVTHLEDELDGVAGDTVNYEGMKGSDALGEHQVAVILGSQHYSDHVPEKWALVAGEDAGRGDTHGSALDYGSDVANAYLRHMREDHTMQAALRAGRNEEDTVVFTHTSALRDDLPVVDEGAVLSAHSQGTLAVVEAAAEFRERPFTAREVADAIADDGRAVGVRQVQNILADLRESGHLRVERDPNAGRAGEYELDEDPGLADVDLPALEDGLVDSENEIPANGTLHTWNFAFATENEDDSGVVPSSTPIIPAADTTAAVSDGADPPG